MSEGFVKVGSGMAFFGAVSVITARAIGSMGRVANLNLGAGGENHL